MSSNSSRHCSSSTRSAPEWNAVEVLRAGPNPRWKCKSCNTNYTGAPRRIAQHILGVGGIGQIRACPSPRQEYVALMADLMVLDKASGRLVRKTTFGFDNKDAAGDKHSSGGGGGGEGGEDESPSPVKAPKQKPRSAARSSGDHLLAAAATVAAPSAFPERFEVFVAKEDFKFSSSHFVAFDGFRERIHGHNYSCSIRLRGEVCEDGYVVDFGIVKKVMRKLCKELNERFLCPMESDALEITLTGTQVVIVCQDGATFVLPRDDCALLPLVHSTAEELAHFLFTRLLREFSLQYLHSRGVTDMDVSVAELPRQEATYRGRIPLSEDKIQAPPFRTAKRVHGCFSHNEDNADGYSISFSGGGGGGGGGGEMDVSNGNNMDMGVNELSPHADGAGLLGLTSQNRLRQQTSSPFGAREMSGGGGGGGSSSSGSWNFSGGGGGGGGGRALSLGSSPSSGGMVGRVHVGGAKAGGGSGAVGVGVLSGPEGAGGMLAEVRSNSGMSGMSGTSQGFTSQGGGGRGGGGVLGLGQDVTSGL